MCENFVTYFPLSISFLASRFLRQDFIKKIVDEWTNERLSPCQKHLMILEERLITKRYTQIVTIFLIQCSKNILTTTSMWNQAPSGTESSSKDLKKFLVWCQTVLTFLHNNTIVHFPIGTKNGNLPSVFEHNNHYRANSYDKLKLVQGIEHV